ncbi:MAG: hypothetical protein HC772_08280 [Leptolyngbyaceae cyanobacterium CRU_2_3]|nr:hypothetical protein [Leptolyngbyaceae cyanobacterium CRU_2_3]
MIPTILVGLGGTGAEVLLRVRQLTEANYGDLKRFPILSFLWIDTDKNYRVNQSAARSLLQDHEQLWATVKSHQGRDMLADMHHYPWVESWFPKTLAQDINTLETGAGQIRTYGRLAFFCHYLKIREKFNAAHNQIKGHEDFMLDEHGIRVLSHAVNVFVVSSLSGGTGSGMIIDMAYCMRHWLQERESPVLTAITSLPNAFTSSEASDRS